MKRLLLAIVIIVVGLSASGCTGKSHDSEQKDVAKSGTNQKVPEDAEQLDERQTETEKNTEIVTYDNNGEIASEWNEESTETILLRKDYKIGDEEVELFFAESEEGYEFNVWVNSTDEETAAMMLVCFIENLEELDIYDNFSIYISVDGCFVLYNASGEEQSICGTNRDGTVALAAPDWIESALGMSEDAVLEIDHEVLGILKDYIGSWN